MKPNQQDLRAEEIRAALAAIANENGGYLSPAAVVEAAKEPGSVLHAEFEWDDAAAAESYRLAQAGALIRRVKFTLVREDKATKEIEMRTTRAYQSRPSARTAEKGYEPVADIMRDESKRDELIAQVLKELLAYRKRYADLVALSAIWNAIDDAIEESAPSQGKAGQAGHGVESRVV